MERKITAADPRTPGLSVTTAAELAEIEREEARKQRALRQVNKELAQAAGERKRIIAGGRLRWVALLLLVLSGALGCDAPACPADAGADLVSSDLADTDAAYRSPCDDLPGGGCLLCDDDRKDCRPAAPPECTSCSWTETLNCVPSACMEFRYGVKCCTGASATVRR